ncbi:EcsC family protein [Cohnella lupini]|uniref:EcsC family protein n=1 Tax=Cohnella lupini TaxID=1294267 RepID=A0A3D9HQU3_9BACL|nr:EcsC family protein [Cohnella lupini]RED51887.1 EcsC family protein [Cohnella lupini]
MDSEFEEYDFRIIQEIVRHEVEPTFVQKALSTMGKPVDKLLGWVEKVDNKHVNSALNKINGIVENGLKLTIKAGNRITSEENVLNEYKKIYKLELSDVSSIRKLSIQQMDRVADTYDFSNGFLVATEGAILGAAATLSEIIPFAQIVIPSIVVADVTASMTIMSRHVSQIATSYGYSSYDSINIPDILAAMAPVSSSLDEGFLTAKAAAAMEIKNAVEFSAKHVGDLLDDIAAPKLVEFIRAIANRLGLVITEKELGMLVPVAGAVVNGGLNLAFQQTNHTNAKDYFRKLHLIDRYGEDKLLLAIAKERNRLTT